MTITEKAVCEAYTGICFCAGDDTWARYAYGKRLLGRPVFTHEMSDPDTLQHIKRLAYPDFVKICSDQPLDFDLEKELQHEMPVS
ncbi:MAG: hypothetical protein LIP12_01705 [Clostridiales bacterium]|nr:hypothetical protein [Clostridiales bacterium]